MQSNVTSQSAPVRWGVISAANIGVKRTAPAIVASNNGQLVAVASRDPERARELYHFAPNVRIYGDYDSLINDPEIEAIYNPLPNSLHAMWTIKALRAGKHVLCEKPMSITAEQGATVVQVAQEQRRLLMEAFMYRFHPQITWSLEQVAAGRLGQVRLVRGSFSFDIRLRPGDIRLIPELAGGSLMDVGCYLVNLCRAVYSHPPLVVAARVYVPAIGAVEHSTTAVLDFGEGQFGMLDSSFDLPMRQGAEIIGEKGMITIPEPFTSYKSEAIVLLAAEGQVTEQRFPPVDQFQLEVEHFATCIRSGQQPAFSLEETLENMATLEAIYRAAGHAWPIV